MIMTRSAWRDARVSGLALVQIPFWLATSKIQDIVAYFSILPRGSLQAGGFGASGHDLRSAPR